jgi:hypothetical protein
MVAKGLVVGPKVWPIVLLVAMTVGSFGFVLWCAVR